jgi:hypothetical protein
LETNGLLNPQIAPPSNSDVDMANWFKQNGDKNKSVLITNLNSGIILMALSGQPISTINTTSLHYLDGTSKIKNSTIGNKIGYLVYDKRLTFSSQNSTSIILGQYVYFSKNIHTIIPSNAHIVHENDNYIICEIT